MQYFTKVQNLYQTKKIKLLKMIQQTQHIVFATTEHTIHCYEMHGYWYCNGKQLNNPVASGYLLNYHTLKVADALQNIEVIPTVLQELTQNLFSLEKAARNVKCQSNTHYTHMCNHIQALKRIQRQLFTALAIDKVPDTS